MPSEHKEAIMPDESEQMATDSPRPAKLDEAGQHSMQGPVSQEDKIVEHEEDVRMDKASEGIRKIDWLKPEKWRDLDQYERRVALDSVGRELQDAYHHPKPPLLLGEDESKSLQGDYSDDDYRIFMNKAAVANRGQKLFGKDPTEALRTYAHEWRHSYQHEQATRWEKPQFQNLVDDPDQSGQWSANIRDYKSPPDDDLAALDPERYKAEYEAYSSQPVEADARRFADRLVAIVLEQQGEEQ